MTDQQYLIWLHNRLIKIYGENPKFEHVLRLKAISENSNDAITTPSQAAFDAPDEFLDISEPLDTMQRRQKNAIIKKEFRNNIIKVMEFRKSPVTVVEIMKIGRHEYCKRHTITKILRQYVQENIVTVRERKKTCRGTPLLEYSLVNNNNN